MCRNRWSVHEVNPMSLDAPEQALITADAWSCSVFPEAMLNSLVLPARFAKSNLSWPSHPRSKHDSSFSPRHLPFMPSRPGNELKEISISLFGSTRSVLRGWTDRDDGRRAR